MFNSISATNRHKIEFVLSRTLGLTTITWLVVANLFKKDWINTTDFLWNFYPAAQFFLQRRPAEIYPPLHACSFIGAGLDTYAHHLFPDVSAGLTAAFHEPPILAMLLAPVALLAPLPSLFLWQALSILALWAGCRLASNFSRLNTKELFWWSFAFFPIFHLLSMGQMGLVFGVLPLIGGYLCLRRKLDWYCGLCWSITFFKPQFLVPVLLICIVLFLHKRRENLLGLLLGLTLIQGLTFLFFPFNIFRIWMHSLTLSANAISDPAHKIPSHLIACLPGTLSVYMPSARLIIYALVFAFACYLMFQCCRMLKTKNDSNGIDLLCIIVVGATPLLAPYLLFYDLSMLVLPGILIFCGQKHDQLMNKIRQLALAIWILIDIYFVLILIWPSSVLTQPLVFILIYSLMYLLLLRKLLVSVQQLES